MNCPKIDFKKIKKITIIEVLVAIFVIVACAIYFSPHFINKQEDMKNAKARANNAIFTSKVLQEFAHNKNISSSEVAQKVCDELNKTTKNPYNKKSQAYTFEKECSACTSVEYFNSIQMVVITTYNKDKELIARTVIKPPSFVEYNKNNK